MKKSIVISLLTVAILLGTALYSFASTGKVTTDTLKLRKEASTDSTVIGLLSENDKVEILGEEYGWYKVKAGDKVGYVASQYINVLTDSKTNNENLNKDNNNNNTNTDTNTNADNTGDNQGEDTNNTNGEKVEVLVAGQKIYITPLINALVLEELKEDKKVERISEINGWSYIKVGTTSGWVRTENIQKKDSEVNTSNPENNGNNNTSSQKTGYITTNSVNFRKTPSTSGEIIRKLSRNAEVKIIAKDEGWTQVEYDGDTGYVSTDYISDKKADTTSRSNITRTASTNKEEKAVTNSEQKVTSGTVTGSDVLEYAKQYLGYKYTPGGSTPKSGFDCSGFTTYVYSHFGVSLSRTSSGQSSNGVKVDKENLAVGDIICFSSSSSSKRIGHVGIYAGARKIYSRSKL